MPRTKPPPKENLPRHRRKINAERLIFRYFLDDMPLADCWLQVHPGTTASRRTMGKMASEEISWYRSEYPLGTEQVLHLKHMGTNEAIDKLKELTEAMVLVKIGVKRVSDGEGSYRNEYVFEEQPAPKIQIEALKLWFQVLGLIGGGRKGVVPPGDALEGGEPGTTGDGPPPRRIHGGDDLTPEQWMEQWNELQEDRRVRRERDGLTGDDDEACSPTVRAVGEGTARP